MARAQEEVGTRVPKYLLFVTNVVLSPVHQVGGRDRFDQLIDEYSDLGILRCHAWAYDDLCTHLDTAVDVRPSYLGYLLTGDVLARLLELLGESVTDIAGVLTEHATMRLANENTLRLTDAGDHAESRPLRLSQVVVDVPGPELAVACLDGDDGRPMSWASSHTLRRTIVSQLHAAGMPTAAIADQTGHRDLRVLEEHYIARIPSSSAAADLLDVAARSGDNAARSSDYTREARARSAESER